MENFEFRIQNEEKSPSQFFISKFEIRNSKFSRSGTAPHSAAGRHPPSASRALRCLQSCFLVGDEAEDVELPFCIEMLRHLEELHGKKGVQTLVEVALPPVEGQLGDVGHQHVLVEAAVLVEEDSVPQIVARGAFQRTGKEIASVLLAN